jgi:hypothetical protein
LDRRKWKSRPCALWRFLEQGLVPQGAMLANLEVAGRLYIALCAQYPGRFITLFDENGVRVSAFNKSDVPVKMHGMSAIHVIIGAIETVGPPPDRLVTATDCRCVRV